MTTTAQPQTLALPAVAPLAFTRGRMAVTAACAALVVLAPTLLCVREAQR
ncbi:MAG: hypothetical protein QOG62_1462 [Thermoleophilaceae bacterium]|jgi:hypothetical protein|nr:hypothetical protein [Thermoleophilaceae bacterium]